MVNHSHQKTPQSVLIIFPILSFIVVVPINASNKILEEPTTEIKCGSCPCVNPCGQQSLPPPPPPPPLPPPPLPRFTYCNPTPPTPPPPPRFYYVTGVPGQLYTVDQDDRWTFFSNAERNFVGAFMLLVGYGLLGLFIVH